VNPFLDLRERARSLSDVAAYYAFYGVGDKKMTGEGEPERLTSTPWLPSARISPRIQSDCGFYYLFVLE
jgi:hypothetical protein